MLTRQLHDLHAIGAEFLASLQGLEPRLTVLETDVLPLHQRDIVLVMTW